MKKDGLSQKKKEKSMNIIMHDALHYFERNGYDNTTVEQLCQEAMISQSTFFNYFGTKEKIVEIIAEDGYKDFVEFSEKAMAEAENPLDGLKASLDFQANASEKYCNTTSVFFRLCLQREEFRALEMRFIDHIGELIIQAFEASGMKLQLGSDILKELIGGYFIVPFMSHPPEEAGERVRKTTSEFIYLLKKL